MVGKWSAIHLPTTFLRCSLLPSFQIGCLDRFGFKISTETKAFSGCSYSSLGIDPPKKTGFEAVVLCLRMFFGVVYLIYYCCGASVTIMMCKSSFKTRKSNFAFILTKRNCYKSNCSTDRSLINYAVETLVVCVYI